MNRRLINKIEQLAPDRADSKRGEDDFEMNIWLVISSAALFLFTPATAWAYLDPGSGSFFFQLFIASFLGIFFALKAYWRHIKNMFLKMMGKEIEEPPSEDVLDDEGEPEEKPAAAPQESKE